MNSFVLSKQQLRDDLMQAYLDARRHKRNRKYQLTFESDLENNLDSLCTELYERRYEPQPSECFIITDPKKREVFAASFRDRIVHHLYYNYVHEMFERTFISDTYSCIKGRGTHYGIRRLESHIRRESQNFTQPCYVLKMDIRGYFMNINRIKLLELCMSTFDRMKHKQISKYGNQCWCEKVDMDFLRYLTREIVMLDCTQSCIIKGSPDDWNGLPRSKSLFFSQENCGLPIGNLTSQLFSNIYMNQFDQYMKRQLRCRHYGRYVDDFYVVSSDSQWLHSLIPCVRNYLKTYLGLTLHEGKLTLYNVRKGVEFLGAFIKPFRNLVSSTTLKRMKPKILRLAKRASQEKVWSKTFAEKLRSSINSFCGVMGHYHSYKLRKKIWTSEFCSPILRYGHFDSNYTKLILPK